MMEHTAKLLGEIAELKEYKHRVGKALARIGHWHDLVGGDTAAFEAKEVEWGTLESILRIFKEEGVSRKDD